MGRPIQYDTDQMISAATRVVAKHGPTNTTIARIATSLDAPTGSIYHRFGSRDILLGETWIRAATDFQSEALIRLQGADPFAAGMAAVVFVPQWVRRNPELARVLLLHRREDFADQRWPASLTSRARELRVNLREEYASYAKRLTGHTDKQTLRILSFALAEAPVAAVRPHIEAKQPPPTIVDRILKTTFVAATELC